MTLPQPRLVANVWLTVSVLVLALSPALGNAQETGLPPVEPFSLSGGDIVVADAGASRVVVVDSSKTVKPIATGLSKPAGVAIEASGDVLVAESGGGRVLRLKRAGSAESVASGLSSPEDVVSDGRAIYVAEMGGSRVLRISGTETTVLGSDFPGPTGVDLPASGRGAGSLVVAFRGRAPFDGRMVLIPLGGGSPSPFAREPFFELTAHIDAAPDGVVYLSDPAGRIVADDGSGGRRVVRQGSPLSAPTGMAVDSDSLLITHDDELIRMDPRSGEFVSVAKLTDPSGVDVVPGAAGTRGTPPPSPSPTPTGGGGGGEGGGRCDRKLYMATVRRVTDQKQQEQKKKADDAVEEIETEILPLRLGGQQSEMQRMLDEAIRVLEGGLKPLPPPAPIEDPFEAMRKAMDDAIKSLTGPPLSEQQLRDAIADLARANDELNEAREREMNEALDSLEQFLESSRQALAALDAQAKQRLDGVDGILGLDEGTLAEEAAQNGCTAIRAAGDQGTNWPLWIGIGVGCAAALGAAGFGISRWLRARRR